MKRTWALITMGCCFVGLLLFCGIYALTQNEIFAYIGIGMGVGIYVANFFNCCPHCGRHLGRNISPSYCPHCGERL